MGEKSYRNAPLLGLAQLAPGCMSCNRANHGQVVAAHSNQGRDGKGLGIKASDAAVAFLCHDCHMHVDQGSAPAAVRLDMWEAAHRATMRWLIESGHLIVSVVPQSPPPAPPKPKAKIPKGRKLQGRGFDKDAPPRKIASRGFGKRTKG